MSSLYNPETDKFSTESILHSPTALRAYRGSNIPTSCYANRLTCDIGEQRARHGQHSARGLGGGARPPERDIGIRAGARGGLLGLRDSQRDLLAVDEDEAALLLVGGQAGLDVAKRDGVGPHAERGPPLLGDGLGHAGHAGLGEGVVELAGVAVQARGAGDVDDAPRLAVLDAEEGRGFAGELEGDGAVEGDDGVPLLVGHLDWGLENWPRDAGGLRPQRERGADRPCG